MKPSKYIRKGWCQGVSARDNRGHSCSPISTSATQWCLIGALNAAYPEHNKYREKIVSKLILRITHLRFAEWNDNPKRTQAEVVAVLQAIGE